MLFRESKNKEKQKDEATEKDKIKQNALEEINKMHKGMFEELQNSSEECVRCVVYNNSIKLWPERGSLSFNLNEHAKKHQQAELKESSPLWTPFLSQQSRRNKTDNYRTMMQPFVMGFINDL